MIFTTAATLFLLLVIFLIATGDIFRPYLKVMLILVFLVGLYFVYNPDQLDRLARIVGVELGSDLVFYVSTMLVIYTVLLFYHKFINLNRRLELLVRNMAIEKARNPVSHDRDVSEL